MEIQIDGQRCQGHGRCYALAPQLFDSENVGNGEIRPEALGELVPTEVAALARRAAANCPEQAIVVTSER